MQWGGYDQGNGTNGLYQGQLGGDFKFPNGGILSLDGVVSYATDAANLGTFSGTCAVVKSGPFAGQVGCTDGVPTGYNNTDLTATLSNNTGCPAGRQIQVASLDFLWRVRLLQAGEPQR